MFLHFFLYSLTKPNTNIFYLKNQSNKFQTTTGNVTYMGYLKFTPKLKFFVFMWNDRQQLSVMTTHPHCFCNFVLLLWKRKHFWLEFLWWTILVLQLGPNLQQKCKLQAQFHEKHVNHTGEKGCKRVGLRWKVKREWLI